jgi:hypothetical protein
MSNRHTNEGIEVGDIFVASWGYGQTNVNAFQVTKVVGKSSVMIREIATEPVYLNNQTEDQRHNAMQGHCKPVKDHFKAYSVLIDDQEKGVRKMVTRLKEGAQLVKVGSGDYWAFKWDGKKEYRESWYY